MSEVDFSLPIFRENPEHWRSAKELADGFLLAWALEVRERQRVERPFGSGGVRCVRLPPEPGRPRALPIVSVPKERSTNRSRITVAHLISRVWLKVRQTWGRSRVGA